MQIKFRPGRFGSLTDGKTTFQGLRSGAHRSELNLSGSHFSRCYYFRGGFLLFLEVYTRTQVRCRQGGDSKVSKEHTRVTCVPVLLTHMPVYLCPDSSDKLISSYVVFNVLTYFLIRVCYMICLEIITHLVTGYGSTHKMHQLLASTHPIYRGSLQCCIVSSRQFQLILLVLRQ